MSLQVKNNINQIDSSVPAERIEDIIAVEEKQFLDLLSDIIFQDILNQVKSDSNEK
jgi:hypothetical protein